MSEKEWLDNLPTVRIELGRKAIFTRVWINGEEWAASVRGIAIDVQDGKNVVSLKFYAKVTAEGPVPLKPWPIVVESEPS